MAMPYMHSPPMRARALSSNVGMPGPSPNSSGVATSDSSNGYGPPLHVNMSYTVVFLLEQDTWKQRILFVDWEKFSVRFVKWNSNGKKFSNIEVPVFELYSVVMGHEREILVYTTSGSVLSLRAKYQHENETLFQLLREVNEFRNAAASGIPWNVLQPKWLSMQKDCSQMAKQAGLMKKAFFGQRRTKEGSWGIGKGKGKGKGGKQAWVVVTPGRVLFYKDKKSDHPNHVVVLNENFKISGDQAQHDIQLESEYESIPLELHGNTKAGADTNEDLEPESCQFTLRCYDYSHFMNWVQALRFAMEGEKGTTSASADPSSSGRLGRASVGAQNERKEETRTMASPSQSHPFQSSLGGAERSIPAKTPSPKPLGKVENRKVGSNRVPDPPKVLLSAHQPAGMDHRNSSKATLDQGFGRVTAFTPPSAHVNVNAVPASVQPRQLSSSFDRAMFYSPQPSTSAHYQATGRHLSPIKKRAVPASPPLPPIALLRKLKGDTGGRIYDTTCTIGVQTDDMIESAPAGEDEDENIRDYMTIEEPEEEEKSSENIREFLSTDPQDFGEYPSTSYTADESTGGTVDTSQSRNKRSSTIKMEENKNKFFQALGKTVHQARSEVKAPAMSEARQSIDAFAPPVPAPPAARKAAPPPPPQSPSVNKPATAPPPPPAAKRAPPPPPPAAKKAAPPPPPPAAKKAAPPPPPPAAKKAAPPPPPPKGNAPPPPPPPKGGPPPPPPPGRGPPPPPPKGTKPKAAAKKAPPASNLSLAEQIAQRRANLKKKNAGGGEEKASSPAAPKAPAPAPPGDPMSELMQALRRRKATIDC